MRIFFFLFALACTGQEHDTAEEEVQPDPRTLVEVVAATRAKYVEAYERLTGRTFA